MDEYAKSANRKKDQDIYTRKNLKKMELESTINESSNIKRIRTEAIDFDWIFSGNKDNAKNMIDLLANHAREKLFIQKSIRTFISFIWSEYQPKIRDYVFIPFCIYLLCFISLSSHYAILVLDEIEEENTRSLHRDKIYLVSISAICIFLLIYF